MLRILAATETTTALEREESNWSAQISCHLLCGWMGECHLLLQEQRREMIIYRPTFQKDVYILCKLDFFPLTEWKDGRFWNRIGFLYYSELRSNCWSTGLRKARSPHPGSASCCLNALSRTSHWSSFLKISSVTQSFRLVSVCREYKSFIV